MLCRTLPIGSGPPPPAVPFRIEIPVVFQQAEKGEHLAKRPLGAAERRLVVISLCPAQSYRSIGCGAAADELTAGEAQRPSVKGGSLVYPQSWVCAGETMLRISGGTMVGSG